MEGAEGNVYVLRRTYRMKKPHDVQLRQSGRNYNGARRHSPSLWHGVVPTCIEMHGGVTGFKAGGQWDWIIAVEHIIDESGFTTQLELEAKIPEWIADSGG